MSRFNTKQEKITTYEGGRAQEKTLEQEWTNMIFSSFLQDGFYESQQDYTERMTKLNAKIIAKYGPHFASKAMDYVRNELGMRTTSALLAAQLNGESFDNKRAAFSNYFHRPDDVSEVFAAIDTIGGKRSHALILMPFKSIRMVNLTLLKLGRLRFQLRQMMMSVIKIGVSLLLRVSLGILRLSAIFVIMLLSLSMMKLQSILSRNLLIRLQFKSL